MCWLYNKPTVRHYEGTLPQAQQFSHNFLSASEKMTQLVSAASSAFFFLPWWPLRTHWKFTYFSYHQTWPVGTPCLTDSLINVVTTYWYFRCWCCWRPPLRMLLDIFLFSFICFVLFAPQTSCFSTTKSKGKLKYCRVVLLNACEEGEESTLIQPQSVLFRVWRGWLHRNSAERRRREPQLLSNSEQPSHIHLSPNSPSPSEPREMGLYADSP